MSVCKSSFRRKELLSPGPCVDLSRGIFIGWWCEVSGKLSDSGWSYTASLRCLRGKGESGCEATGGADTGLGCSCCCSMALCITLICCLAPMRVLQVIARCCSLLAEVVPVLGLVIVDDASLLLDVPLELSEELSLVVD